MKKDGAPSPHFVLQPSETKASAEVPLFNEHPIFEVAKERF